MFGRKAKSNLAPKKKRTIAHALAEGAFAAAIKIGNIDPEKDRPQNYRGDSQFPYQKVTEPEVKPDSEELFSEAQRVADQPIDFPGRSARR